MYDKIKILIGDPEEKLGYPYIILRESLKSFKRNNGLETSATLAFFGFFSLIPLLILIVYLLSNVILSSQVAMKGVEELTEQIFPAYHKVLLKEVYAVARQKTWGLLSIIALFWAVTPLASSLRFAFLKIFKEEWDAPYWKDKLVNAFAVFIILVLFIGVVLGEIVYASLMTPYTKSPSFLFRVFNLIATPLLTTLVITLFYLIFCPVKLKFTNLLVGSFITAVLWLTTKPIFLLFLKFNPNYGVTFGSLKAIFILIIWVYYQFVVILFGMEIMANIRRRETLLLSGLLQKSISVRKGPRRILDRFAGSYSRGEVVCREGEEGFDMFYILSGAVEIRRKEKALRVMKEGEYFGEMAMLLRTPRTATVIAVEDDTRLIKIREDNFETILRENPKIVHSILKEMAERVKKTNELLEEIEREKGGQG
ncbi:MAG: YihY family inner membrane protein [Deltaproteobacteria bacterium]|nr:YihY family inner membrane protein [Deltaproteobacteria bacterium]